MTRTPGDASDALLRILLVEQVGPRIGTALWQALGSWDAIAGAAASSFDRVLAGIPRCPLDGHELRRRLDGADPEFERELMARHGVSLVTLADPDFPALLRLTPDPPLALFVTGTLPEDEAWAVAVVGSRDCTRYGTEIASRIAGDLAGCGLVLVSGGARGIDAAAHRAALRVGGRTIAVLGCGLASVYPPEHAELFESIRDGGGAVISEFPMRVEVRPGHFPRRNRIIAGLALGVVVVEAAVDSGANITARLAVDDLGRVAMAVPGPVHSAVSAGCHRLVRDGAAALVTNAAEVLEELKGMESVRAAAGLGASPARREPEAGEGAGAGLDVRVPRALVRRSVPGALARQVDAICAAEGIDAGRALAQITLAQMSRAQRGACPPGPREPASGKAESVEQRGEHEVGQDHGHHSLHHGVGGGPAHACGAAAHAKTVVAGDQSEDQAEDAGLEEPGEEVRVGHLIDGVRLVDLERNLQGEHAHHAAHHHRREIADHGEHHQ